MLNSAEITQYLSAYQQGDQTAIEHVFPVVYAELKRIAHGQLQKAWSVNTICTTSLVHEAYLKLINAQDQDIKNRSHFFALAATAMRQIIINYAEQKQSQKRGGDWLQVTMEDLVDTPDQNISLLLNVNEAVNDIVKFDDSIAALIEQRFFAGMTEEEIAKAQNVSERTVRRKWQKAKALLSQYLDEGS